jgi:hypothetical protein
LEKLKIQNDINAFEKNKFKKFLINEKLKQENKKILKNNNERKFT